MTEIANSLERVNPDLSFETTRTARTPRWVWCIIVFYAFLEPAIHLTIAHFPPEGVVQSGLHIGDDVFFLQPMRMAETDLFSPYATCKDSGGPHGVRFFPLPYHYLYGAIGAIADLLHLDHFLALGLVNGLGMALYLFIVYRFLVEIVPQYASAAFLLFTLSGGPGGILYAVTGALGLHSAPQFDAFFQRYAWYELVEEGNLTPVHQMVRLYKTLPLALVYLSLTLTHRALRTGEIRPVRHAMLPLCAGTVLNAVYGPLAFALSAALLYLRPHVSRAARLRIAAMLGLSVAAGVILAALVIRVSPTYVDNAAGGLRRAMWFSPFVSAMLWHLFAAPMGMRESLRQLPRAGYVLACATLGYLAVFAVLYTAYQVYYGNFLYCLDFTTTVKISDPALFGALLGGLWGLRRRPGAAADPDTHAWVLLWLLVAVAVALSAFGGGWFLRLAPKRLMWLIALPLCVYSAIGLQRMRIHAPRMTCTLWTVFLVSGAFTIPVAALWFQGPLGNPPGRGPFALLNTQFITQSEATALDALGPGVVLCPVAGPPYIADTVALRPDTRVVFGQGTLDFSDQPIGVLGEDAARFFTPETAPETRAELLRKWCVDYVYCPDGIPVDDAVLTALRAMPELTPIGNEGRAAVFKVVKN